MRVHLLIQKCGGGRVPVAVYSNAERALAAGADADELVPLPFDPRRIPPSSASLRHFPAIARGHRLPGWVRRLKRDLQASDEFESIASAARARGKTRQAIHYHMERSPSLRRDLKRALDSKRRPRRRKP